jgi:hypothetical protein
MKKEYNVLILDDIEIVGVRIAERFSNASSSNFSFTGVKITPHFETIDISDINKAVQKIEYEINTKKIDYLLLDRGLCRILNANDVSNYQYLSNDYLYASNCGKVILIEEILNLISKEIYSKIKGIIIYTFDHTPVLANTIKQLYINILPKNFEEKNIQIILSNSEIYRFAGLSLYSTDKKLPKGTPFASVGLKSDFILYGLFMGEILYHRVISMINNKKQEKFIAKQKLGIRNILILFFTFTALSIGGNVLYDMFLPAIENKYLLLVCSIVFSLLIPLFILLVKPQLIISIDEKDE